MIINFFALKQRSVFSIYDPIDVKLLTRLRLKFSHRNENKFRHFVKECTSPMCDCSTETETTSHFFLRCQSFANKWQKLHDDVYWTDASVKNVIEESLIDVLWYVSDRYNDSKNKQIVIHSIYYIQSTKRFERSLIDKC